MNSKLIKGFLMALAGAAMPLLTVEPVILSMVLITLIGTALLYIGKNAIPELRSKSNEGSLDFVNLISIIIIAIGTSIVSGAASFIVNDAINWGLLLTTCLTVSLTYISATYFEGKKI